MKLKLYKWIKTTYKDGKCEKVRFTSAPPKEDRLGQSIEYRTLIVDFPFETFEDEAGDVMVKMENRIIPLDYRLCSQDNSHPTLFFAGEIFPLITYGEIPP